MDNILGEDGRLQQDNADGGAVLVRGKLRASFKLAQLDRLARFVHLTTSFPPERVVVRLKAKSFAR